MIKIAKWKNNAQSPVMFMVDDLANIWMKKGSHSDLKVGEDWGHFGTEKNSMWSFLNDNLYTLFPNIKTTFFLVVDKRSAMTINTRYTYAEAIDKDEKFIEFLNLLDSDEKVELAYHGTTHGNAGNTTMSFRQEWDTYDSIDQAIETIEYGKELFKKVLGHYPKGGKYCGYVKGEYGDLSINKTNFLWWCRDWDAAIENHSLRSDLSYDLQYFGDTIDIPSTVEGSFLSFKKPRISKKYLTSLYKLLKKQSIEKSIYSRYKERQIISIQEHSSPYRTDGKIQYPNILTDIDNLQYIFDLLNKLDIWYATGTEIAEYFQVYVNTVLHQKTNSFYFSCKNNTNIREGSVVTLILEEESANNKVEILFKEKKYFSYEKNGVKLVDIPVYLDTLYSIL